MAIRILQGDVRDMLKTLEPESVDVCVTSPPYYGLRSYLPDGHPDKHLEIGCEPTLGQHIAVLVGVFEEVRRVLKPKAALWINYGDCYATTVNGRSAADTKAAGGDDRTFRDKPFSTIGGVFKPKDLLLAPFRLAIALQERGWWVRSRCIWGKPNGMPDSSGRYRPSVAHEEIFLLSKSGDLDYDSEAVRRPCDGGDWKMPDGWDTDPGAHGSFHRKGREKGKNNSHGSTLEGGAYGRHQLGDAIPAKQRRSDKQRGHVRVHAGFNDRWDHMTKEEQQENGRLLRTYEPDVWHMATAPFAEAHFATFPPALVERCLMASSKAGQTVLDPFGGAGTTGLVADRMGRNAILIELNQASNDIAENRIKRDCPMFAEVAAE